MAESSEGALLSAADLEQIRRRGIPVEEVERQLALLRDPPPPVVLEAAATPGDGIERLDPAEHGALLELWADAAARGRLRKLVPASGAASRMFASLSRALESDAGLRLASVRARAAAGDATAGDVLKLAERLRDLPFRDALAEALRRQRGDGHRHPGEGAQPAAGETAGADARGDDPLGAIEARDPDADLRPLLAALLEPEGLGYVGMPKGLIPFHRRGERAVTPVEEHLDEAVLLVRDAQGVSRVHFTVAEGAEDGFRRAAKRWRSAKGAPEGASEGAAKGAAEGAAEGSLELELSTQSPATDTVALDAEGRPFRTPEGELLFRPGGHGALLRNLEELGGDLVLVKNIDNVQPAERRGPSILWQRLLAGLLVRLQREAGALLDRLDDASDADACDDARAFLARWLERAGPATPQGWCDARARRELAARLDRPLRVAGMVAVSGEPGGGPFWARGRDGEATKQIVETAEIAKSPEQQAILASSTHFNPVLMALGVRDHGGRPYPLRDFVDPTRPFVTERTAGATKLLALEHPGLWNGSMAGWNTVFVDIPKAAFTPVKTVLDLLRDEHRSGP
ncbi:MAG TPA: DUF4301 family protein [Thermoanaerobaculia bacterium]|nr:DUF4301 family protein [Thermoanaerobaculia bacterium]